MSLIRIVDTGWIDRGDSAFPTIVQLRSGDLVCAFSVGDGQYVHGGTRWARSCDGGKTWNTEGYILKPTTDPATTNSLRLSLGSDGKTVFAYGNRYFDDCKTEFGTRKGDAAYCVSTDNCSTWSRPHVISMPDCPLEISDGIFHLRSGRMLAPAALLAQADKFGEKVLVKLSDSGSSEWLGEATVFYDQSGKLGFWEHKFAELDSGQLLAVAWSVSLGDYRDCSNRFAISEDQGQTWSQAYDTRLCGQTMSPLPIGGDRLLVVYNQRRSNPSVRGALVTLEDRQWKVEYECSLYSPGIVSNTDRIGETSAGIVNKFDSFQFGYPKAIQLSDGTFMLSHWCVENGICGIRWTTFLVDW